MGDEADRLAAEGDEGDECRHGLDVRWCSLCKPQPAAPPKPKREPWDQPGFRRGGTDPGILAEHPGTCAWCAEEIIPGEDRIVYDDVAPGWKHAVCP